MNGLNAVYLNVLRVPGGNTLDIVDAVKRAVENLKDLPPGVEVKAVFDQSTFVRTTYHGGRAVKDATLLRRYARWGRWKYLAYWSEIWNQYRVAERLQPLERGDK